MSTPTSEFLERIQKLQAKATSCAQLGNTAEAELFASKVSELLSRYALSMADVDSIVRDANDPFGRSDANYHPDKQYKQRQAWAELLARVVAEAHFCHRLLNTSDRQVIFIGRQTDREVAVYMFHYLVRVMLAEADIAFKEETRKFNSRLVEAAKALQSGSLEEQVKIRAKYAGDYVNLDAFKEAFYKGFIDTIERRYKEAREGLQAESNNNALVLSKATNAARAWCNANIRTRSITVGSLNGSNANAQRAGWASGSKVSLNTHGVGTKGGQRQIGGS